MGADTAPPATTSPGAPECPHKPSIQGAATGGGLASRWADADPLTSCRHRSPVPAAPTHSVFQERMCLVWLRRCWSQDTENRFVVPNSLSGLMSSGSKRSRVTGVITAARSGHTRSQGESGRRETLAVSSSAGSHIQSSLYGNKAGRALAVSASGKPRFGFSLRAQPGLCLDFTRPQLGWPPGRVHSIQDPSPSGPTLPRMGTRTHHGRQRGTFPETSLRTYYVLITGPTVEPATEEGSRCDDAN